MAYKVERVEYRVIDGKKVRVEVLPTGYGGRAISKAAFGGRKGTRKGGKIGTQESSVERRVV